MSSHVGRTTTDPEVLGGRSCIRGLRVRVKDIPDLLASGASRQDILADYPYLEDVDIAAAREYAARPTPDVLPGDRHAVSHRRTTSAGTCAALECTRLRGRARSKYCAASASDRKIWDHAIASDAVLITKDEDFVTMRALCRRGGPAIVWLRVGNTTTRALIALLNSVLPVIVEAIERGETVIQIPER